MKRSKCGAPAPRPLHTLPPAVHAWRIYERRRTGYDTYMKIVALADIHGKVKTLAHLDTVLARADLVLLLGDLTHFGAQDAAARIVSAVRRHNEQVLAVPGNCDREGVEAYLTAEGINLHGRHEVRDGIAFVGAGKSLPGPFNTPNTAPEEEFERLLEEAWESVPDGMPTVLVAHQPPRDTDLDKVLFVKHVGSRSLRQFVEREQPLLCLSGHIHEAQGTDRIGPTHLVNPGPTPRYAYVEVTAQDGVQAVELRRA